MVILQLCCWKFSHKESLWQTLFDWNWNLFKQKKTKKIVLKPPFKGPGDNVCTTSIARWKACGRLPISHSWTLFGHKVWVWRTDWQTDGQNYDSQDRARTLLASVVKSRGGGQIRGVRIKISRIRPLFQISPHDNDFQIIKQLRKKIYFTCIYRFLFTLVSWLVS